MIPANKGQRYKPEALARHEVEAMLDACAHDFIGRRNAGAIAVMWRTGARVNEVLSARRVDLNLVAGTLRVMWPKGEARGKLPRILGVDAIARSYLEAWLSVRGGCETGHLFTSTTGRRVQTSRLREAVPRLAAAIGQRGRRVSPHMFRHTFAFECAMENRPLPWISQCLGHSDLRTTERYLRHLAPADVIGGMKERA